ncbi:MAG: hypothetical protein K0R87_967 [Pseudonocardia sp.]|nr:hypothetical protein [Pseudonocardia sp.]
MRKVNSTVRMPRIAPAAMIAPRSGSPTSANADEKAASPSMSW